MKARTLFPLYTAKIKSYFLISKSFFAAHGTEYAPRAGYVYRTPAPLSLGAHGRPRRHAPATRPRLGSDLAGADPAAARRRHAALHTGRLPPQRPRGGLPRLPRRPPRTDHRPRMRHTPHPVQPRRAAPQRQQRLHGTDRLVATGHALDPHGVLHHPRRPHRAHHRRNTDPQSPRGARGAGDLRCRRLVAPEPQDTAPHARRGGRDCGFRTGSLPVVHHARHAPQPPQDSGHRRQGRLPGRHKHRQILPRRGLHGQMARRTPARGGRRRGRPATALHRRLGARTR